MGGRRKLSEEDLARAFSISTSIDAAHTVGADSAGSVPKQGHSRGRTCDGGEAGRREVLPAPPLFRTATSAPHGLGLLDRLIRRQFDEATGIPGEPEDVRL